MSRELNKLIDTCNRVVKANTIGFIYNLNVNEEKKLVSSLKCKQAIIYDCRLKKTKSELMLFFENELKAKKAFRIDERLRNIKDRLIEKKHLLVLFNAHVLMDRDYELVENFNNYGAAIVYISSFPNYYQMIQGTKTYKHKPVIEHDFAEIN